MRRIKLLEPWSEYMAGTILEGIEDHLADRLVSQKIAENLTEETEVAGESAAPENAMAAPKTETAVSPKSRRRRGKGKGGGR
ncbi:MAG: hypothetical protein QGD93_10510 [Actinomycetota bacterium]|nr:hypothetical protein [Actinomycetota bacterium]